MLYRSSKFEEELQKASHMVAKKTEQILNFDFERVEDELADKNKADLDSNEVSKWEQAFL